MLLRSPNLQHSPSLTTTSRRHRSGKWRKKRDRQKQPLGMLRIPEGRYNSVSIQSKKLLIMSVSKMIRLMKRALPMLPKNPNLSYTTSLPATSQHDKSEKTKSKKRNQQIQPLVMLRIPKGRYHLVSMRSRKLLTLIASNMIRLMGQALPMLPKSPNLQHSPSLTATSQHDRPGKRRRNKNRQRQPLGMLRIPKGGYHSTSIQSRKLLILAVSEVIHLMK